MRATSSLPLMEAPSRTVISPPPRAVLKSYLILSGLTRSPLRKSASAMSWADAVNLRACTKDCGPNTMPCVLTMKILPWLPKSLPSNCVAPPVTLLSTAKLPPAFVNSSVSLADVSRLSQLMIALLVFTFTVVVLPLALTFTVPGA